MDERYLRFPRWLEASGLPEELARDPGAEAWFLFRRLVEQDLTENLFPDWVDLKEDFLAVVCGLGEEEIVRLFEDLGARGLLRIRNLSDVGHYYQYRIAQPLPVPRCEEAISGILREWGLPDRPELWRYWEEDEGETKYDRILRLYENTCGLKISGRIVEDLVELAERHPYDHLEQAFQAAREQEVKTLGWIRKYLKRLKKDERVRKNWGRPEGLELPEGYTIPSGED